MTHDFMKMALETLGYRVSFDQPYHVPFIQDITAPGIPAHERLRLVSTATGVAEKNEALTGQRFIGKA